ncbi:putative ArsR family transcriptional regulator [Stackebrandtia albiflava]|uniref:Putative ArsR family transcriptional regulator n=1 Tax=Stackebrandtia albiflava TaxID=406432 RepID=A0A562VE58_9ACTN|nr:helix-turn-helix domain-containing protein [Stackebrandtia albiflava]TWJ16148.1 putative ArsR family transcriptional regulator [Stackebrandtia albiflava]
MADEALVSAVAVLAEPTRRALYDFVARQTSPVSRDEAAAAVGVPRNTAAFHLDRLADEGLLTVDHERRTGRSGPGAGRPAKLYRRSSQQITVTLPERRYALIGELLAAAVEEAERTGESARAVLDRRAEELGNRLGHEARRARPAGSGDDPVVAALEDNGFEPRVAGDSIVLGNCPFHDMARRHPALVCGMNLRLVEGMLDGLAVSGVGAALAPGPDRCCVRLERAEPAG